MIVVHSSYAHDYDHTWKMEQASVTKSDILLFITNGKLIYWINDEKVDLQKGEALFIPAGSFRYATSDPLVGHCRYSTHFNILDDSHFLKNVKTYKKVKISNFDYFKQRYVTLNQQWLAKFPYYKEICQAILTEMLALMMREIEREQTQSKKMSHVMELKKYIFHHYRQKIKVTDLAKHIDRSPNYVSTIFKEITGQTPIEYIQYVRISFAKELLVNNSMSVSEVADYLGFCDQFYFHRVFKKVTGYAPSVLLKDRQTL